MYSKNHNNYQVYQNYQPSQNYQVHQPSQNYQVHQHSQNYQQYQPSQNNNQVYKPSQNNQIYKHSQKYQVYQQRSHNYIPSQSNQTSQNYKAHLNYSRQPQVDNVPGPNFEDLDPCLLNVAKSVCKIRIDTNHGSFVGSGFFLKFLINGKFYNWLVTNEHVITKEMIKNKNMIKVWYNIEEKILEIKLDISERYIKTFKEHRVDATVIQIRSHDKVYEDYFLEPELGYANNTLVGKEIFIPQFPGFKQIKNARGNITRIADASSYEFTHCAKTQKGSSGSPIFLKGNKKVIGIHKEGSITKKENYGDFIAPIISILTCDIMLKKMQINNNISFNSQNNFGQVNPNPNNNSNIFGAANPNNQLNPLNQNMMNNNIIAPGNINNLKSQKNNENEERYVGQLVNGLRHGKGIMKSKKDGKINYQGAFVINNHEGY